MFTHMTALFFLVAGAVAGLHPVAAFVAVEEEWEQDDASDCVVFLQTTASYRIKTSKSGDAGVTVDVLDAQAFQFLAPRSARFDRAKVAKVAAPALPSNETDGRASIITLQAGVEGRELVSDLCRLLSQSFSVPDSDDAAGAITCEDGLHVPLSLLQTSARYRLKHREGHMRQVSGRLPHDFDLEVSGRLAIGDWEEDSDEEWPPGVGGLQLKSSSRRHGKVGDGSATYLLQTSATYRLVRGGDEGADGSAPVLRPRQGKRSSMSPISRGFQSCEQRHLAWSQERVVKMEISDETFETVFELLAEDTFYSLKV